MFWSKNQVYYILPTSSIKRKAAEHWLDGKVNRCIQLVSPITCVWETLEMYHKNSWQLPNVKLLGCLLMTLAYRTVPTTLQNLRLCKDRYKNSILVLKSWHEMSNNHLQEFAGGWGKTKAKEWFHWNVFVSINAFILYVAVTGMVSHS